MNKNKFINNKGFVCHNMRSTLGGFTLVELMVAISIFTMIMVMAMGSLIVASDASGKAKELRIAMDNVNFEMENMTRYIRMGHGYTCDGACSSGVENIYFIASDGSDISYSKDGDKLVKSKSGSYDNMASPDIQVDVLKFYINGITDGDNTQPSVYIIMKGTVSVKDGSSTSFALQTLASQRNLE